VAHQLTLSRLLEADDEDLGASEWVEIGQSRIDGFAEATEDRQWIHVDPQRAAETPFGTTIAHGYLVLAMVPKLLFAMADFPDSGMLVNYGIDKLRFIKPVPSGSWMRLEVKLVSGQKRAGGVLFRTRINVVLREDGRRAMTAELLFLALPRLDVRS